MNRKQADALVGQSVRAWTAANGIYVGTLVSVSGSPWRGQVRVTGIIEPAQHFERGALCRRGFRYGETIEVGHSSITPCQDPGRIDYVDALIARKEKLRAMAQHSARYSGLLFHCAWAIDIAIAAEHRRLAGEPWRLQPSDAARPA